MAKKTVFYELHRRAGAKMTDFAGYEMPVEYQGVNAEHINVREKAGVFDVSHMGEFWVKGPSARNFLQKVTSNDIDKLKPGKIQYSCLPNKQGGIVDDLLIYQYEDQKYMLVVNASNIEKDLEWLKSNNQEGVEIEDASNEISLLAVQGPETINVLQKLTDVKLSDIKYYNFVTGEVAGIKNVIISNTGYTGAGGFELYFYNDGGPELWKRIMEAGKELGIKPAGLAARDTLRLEMGFCLYGNDINATTSPIEAGLGWITKFTENNNFIGRDIFERQKEEGVKRKLVGFEMEERGIPRQHYPVLSLYGEEIGEVTSGTMSPMLKKGIGMAYVKPTFSTEGTMISIKVRNKNLKAKVVKPPFFKKNV
jgi:aminomethyltransferase